VLTVTIVDARLPLLLSLGHLIYEFEHYFSFSPDAFDSRDVLARRSGLLVRVGPRSLALTESRTFF
jgi:hypothetical protein